MLNPFNRSKTTPIRPQAERLFPKELTLPERDWSSYDVPTWIRTGSNVALADVNNENAEQALEVESFEARKARVLSSGESLRSFARTQPVALIEIPAVAVQSDEPQVHHGEFIEYEPSAIVDDVECDQVAGWIVGVVEKMGHFPYKFRTGQNRNFVVRVSGTDIWGVDLAEATQQAGVEVGDKIALKKVSKSDVEVEQKLLDIYGEVRGTKLIRAHKNHWLVKIIEKNGE